LSGPVDGSDKQSTYPAYTWSADAKWWCRIVWFGNFNWSQFSVIIETAELSKNEYIQNEELSENNTITGG
jgi:hypothetical protein